MLDRWVVNRLVDNHPLIGKKVRCIEPLSGEKRVVVCRTVNETNVQGGFIINSRFVTSWKEKKK